MRLFKQSIIFPATLLAVMLSGCYSDKTELLYPAGTCNTDSATYSGKVKSILTLNCVRSGCHDAASAMSGVVLDNIAGAQAIAKDGRLMGTISHAPGFSQMPKNLPKMDECSINQINAWVAAGALNN